MHFIHPPPLLYLAIYIALYPTQKLSKNKPKMDDPTNYYRCRYNE